MGTKCQLYDTRLGSEDLLGTMEVFEAQLVEYKRLVLLKNCYFLIFLSFEKRTRKYE